MCKVTFAVLLWVSTASAQTVIPGGVPMGNTDAGAAVKRRLDQAGGQVTVAPAKTSQSAAAEVISPSSVRVPPSRTRGVIRGRSKEGLTLPGPIADSEVIAESAAVYRGISAQGTPVARLKRGDKVWIDFEFKSAKSSWCSIKQARQAEAIGYVNCAELRRVPGGNLGPATQHPAER
jgi:hypothetical protein